MEIAYWTSKGRVHPIRWLIAYTGLPISETNLNSLEEWQQQKEILRSEFPFPNLPYFYDKTSKVLITETKAIFLHICYLRNMKEMGGKCSRDKIQVEMLYGVISDIKDFFWNKRNKTTLQIAENFEDDCNNFLMAKLHGLSRYLNEKEFFLVYLTIVDFELVYLFDLFDVLCNKCGINHPWNAFPNLLAHMERFKSLPGIKDFCEEDERENYVLVHRGKLVWLDEKGQ